MAALHKALHIERVVIVTPSVYGADNSATLFGLQARGPTARAVAVIDDNTTEGELDAMHAAGFRGMRLNLWTGGISDPQIARQRFQAAMDRMKARGWHIQFFAEIDDIGDQGSGDGLAGADRVRSFRRREPSAAWNNRALLISWTWSNPARPM